MFANPSVQTSKSGTLEITVHDVSRELNGRPFAEGPGTGSGFALEVSYQWEGA